MEQHRSLTEREIFARPCGLQDQLSGSASALSDLRCPIGSLCAEDIGFADDAGRPDAVCRVCEIFRTREETPCKIVNLYRRMQADIQNRGRRSDRGTQSVEEK